MVLHLRFCKIVYIFEEASYSGSRDHTNSLQNIWLFFYIVDRKFRGSEESETQISWLNQESVNTFPVVNPSI